MAKKLYDILEEDNYSFDYEIRIYLVDDKAHYYGYLERNVNHDDVDEFGYRPGFYIDDHIMDWCYESFGDGSNGKFQNDMFYQGRSTDGPIDLRWWIDWTWSHALKTHYIIGHFRNIEDAVLFKLRWA